MRSSTGYMGGLMNRPSTTIGKSAHYIAPDPDFCYGKPLRPPTPIKAVVGNYYGEIASYQQISKTAMIRENDEMIRISMNNPPREHTRASAIAQSYVLEREKQKTNEPKSIFKMQKFLQVQPRTSTKNENYKPIKRTAQSTKRGSKIPVK